MQALAPSLSQAVARSRHLAQQLLDLSLLHQELLLAGPRQRLETTGCTLGLEATLLVFQQDQLQYLPAQHQALALERFSP
jgi:hypothetical protein